MTNELQKTWDACLIRCWRQNLTVLDALMMFKSIAGSYPENLLRIPKKGFPAKINVRVFVDTYLNKISTRLWAQSQDKDVLLLRKLQESKYDTQYASNNVLNDIKNESQKAKKNVSKISLDKWKYDNRNHATDWNTHQ